jgi:hypothetical protein
MKRPEATAAPLVMIPGFFLYASDGGKFEPYRRSQPAAEAALRSQAEMGSP